MGEVARQSRDGEGKQKELYHTAVFYVFQFFENSIVLEKYGLCVLRFSNLDIDTNFEGVCYIIDKTIKERTEQKDK
jgi:hypothetical protein